MRDHGYPLHGVEEIYFGALGRREELLDSGYEDAENLDVSVSFASSLD